MMFDYKEWFRDVAQNERYDYSRAMYEDVAAAFEDYLGYKNAADMVDFIRLEFNSTPDLDDLKEYISEEFREYC